MEQVEENPQGIRAQLERFLDFGAEANPARMVNNVDWLRPVGFLDFLRDVGKHFTVNYMMAKESVKRRLEATRASRSPSSATCCSRPTTTCVLHDRFGCNLQMGGSDQWGNITAGMRPDPQSRAAHAPTAWCCRW